MTCDHVQKIAATVMALPPTDADRICALAHAQTCPTCASKIYQGEQLWALLGDAVPNSAVAPQQLAQQTAQLMAAIAQDDHQQQRLNRWLSILAVGAITIIAGVLLLASHRAWVPRVSMAEWVGAAVLFVSSVAIILLRRQRVLVPLLMAIGSSAAVNLILHNRLAANTEPLYHCAGLELFGGALMFGFALLWPALRSTRVLFATGLCGAVATQAALHLSCANQSLFHLLAVHTGGVLLSTAVMALGLYAARYSSMRFSTSFEK